MTTFVFFKKRQSAFALDKTDSEKTSRLKSKG